MNYNKLTEKDRNILVDGKELTIMLLKGNEWAELYGYYYGLFSSLCNENQGEIRYIKELVSRKIDCNFPILVCNCNFNFNCTVALVKVKFCDNCVKWEKIGIMKIKEHIGDFQKNYSNSGIRRVEDWSDNDWERYGGIAYDLLQDYYFFHDWCSKNWQEELYRRCWGYYHKYFNDDSNIDWTSELDFKFELNEYKKFFCGESA